jgi:pimeloyl-ACP methyl ester carboxylesterase
MTAVLALAVLAAGCSGKKPLETLRYESEPTPNKGLIIFLQGMGGTTNCFIAGHKCFATEGFVEAVRSRGLPYDMAAPGTHFGYYKDRTLEERLRADVIQPARARGYERIWLVGVSMGGLGSLIYTQHHPHDVDGVLTLGPFLGYDKIIDEITDAGGVDRWQPGSFDGREDWQRMLWQWLKERSRQPDATPIFLGYGNNDPYLKAHRLLAATLPPQQVLAIDGGHSFSTFRTIWEEFLDRGHLDR